MPNVALVVGINTYDAASNQTPLSGAVNDACDFADWALDPAGGNVAPEDLHLWVYPPPAQGDSALSQRVRSARAQVNPDWQLASQVVGPPDETRGPYAAEIFNTSIRKSEPFRADRYEDNDQDSRIYVFLAGHGLRHKEYGSSTQQTCFIAHDFKPGFGPIQTGLVGCESLRRSLRDQGFKEVVMFLDCCRNKVTGLRRQAQPFSDLTEDYELPTWGVGNAAEDGKFAHETTGHATVRGAFSATLLKGLREHRIGQSNTLTIKQLEDYVRSNIADVTPHDQYPDFRFNPENQPMVIVSGPPILPGGAQARPRNYFRFHNIEPGTRFLVVSTGLKPVAGVGPILAATDDVPIPPLPTGVYSIEQEDNDSCHANFRYPSEEIVHVR